MRPSLLTLMFVGCVVCFGLGYVSHRPTPISVAQAHAATVRAEQVVATIAPAVVRRDSILERVVDHYHTVRESIPVHVVDTVHDTTWVTRFIDACDRLASGCVAFRDTARLQHAADTTLIASLRQELHATQVNRPSRFRQLLWFGAAAAGGYAAGRAHLAVHLPSFSFPSH